LSHYTQPNSFGKVNSTVNLMTSSGSHISAELEFLLQSGKQPDVIRCHDWHTAVVVTDWVFLHLLNYSDQES
jgi:glycogen synthase